MKPILDQFGQPYVAEARSRTRRIRAKYDSAQTTDDNSRHWANADMLSADASASLDVRKRIRSRARYECQEANSFGKGMILTLSNDSIGIGPRLQVLTGDKEANERVEREFKRWFKEARIASKLRTARMAKCVDGETFLMAINNERLPGRVKADVRVIECDLVTTPQGDMRASSSDGIRYDEAGNPVEYDLLRVHPGTDKFNLGSFMKADQIPAESMIHLFREDRPGQRRGVSELATALPLFAQLRRYTLAVIAAAETAAEFAGVMYTDSPALDEIDDVEAMDAIELEMRSMLTLPKGWKLGQIKAEQPSTTYEMFRNAILNEIARCINMPFNKAIGNSSGYNFASGRLDHQTYFESIDVERTVFDLEVLDRMLVWWSDEAAMIPGLLPEGIGPIADLPHRWAWPAHRHVDPQKEANAAKTLWELGLLTDDGYLVREGVDPEEHFTQLEQQIERRTRLGLPVPGAASAGPATAPEPTVEVVDEDDEDDDDSEPQPAGANQDGDEQDS
jgi:lambda family phage portal protein